MWLEFQINYDTDFLHTLNVAESLIELEQHYIIQSFTIVTLRENQVLVIVKVTKKEEQ
jgi:hypothetical protein